MKKLLVMSVLSSLSIVSLQGAADKGIAIELPNACPTKIVWNPNGSHIGVTHNSSSAFVCSAQSGEVLSIQKNPGNCIYSMGWSADGTQLALVTNKYIDVHGSLLEPIQSYDIAHGIRGDKAASFALTAVAWNATPGTTEITYATNQRDIVMPHAPGSFFEAKRSNLIFSPVKIACKNHNTLAFINSAQEIYLYHGSSKAEFTKINLHGLDEAQQGEEVVASMSWSNNPDDNNVYITTLIKTEGTSDYVCIYHYDSKELPKFSTRMHTIEVRKNVVEATLSPNLEQIAIGFGNLGHDEGYIHILPLNNTSSSEFLE